MTNAELAAKLKRIQAANVSKSISRRLEYTVMDLLPQIIEALEALEDEKRADAETAATVLQLEKENAELREKLQDRRMLLMLAEFDGLRDRAEAAEAKVKRLGEALK